MELYRGGKSILLCSKKKKKCAIYACLNISLIIPVFELAFKDSTEVL